MRMYHPGVTFNLPGKFTELKLEHRFGLPEHCTQKSGQLIRLTLSKYLGMVKNKKKEEKNKVLTRVNPRIDLKKQDRTGFTRLIQGSGLNPTFLSPPS